MGAKLTKALPEYSSSELAGIIETHLGSVYSKYAPSVDENCVDGALIAEMSESEFQETLEDLGIRNRLHCRVLTKEWKVAKEFCPPSPTFPLVPPVFSPTPTTKDIGDGFTPPPAQSSMSIKKSPAIESSDENSMIKTNGCTTPKTPNAVLSAQYQAAAEYELMPDTPDSEVDIFDSVAEKVRQSSKNGFIYSGVNLLSPDQQVGLGSRLAVNGDIMTHRLHVPAQHSYCLNLLLDKNTPDFIQSPLPESIIEATMKSSTVLPPDCTNPHYYGHVVRSQNGERVGMVCLVEERCSNSLSYLSEQERTLMELAQKTEQQLDMRRSLLQRNRYLHFQQQKLQANPNDGDDNSTRELLTSLVTSSKQGLSELAARDRESWFPMPEDLAKSGKPARSYLLPKVQQNIATTKEEMTHLPSDYFDIMDQQKFTDPSPVAKNDRERCAAIEAIRLKDIDPSGPTGRALKNIAKMTCSLLNVAFAHISFLTHDTQYSLATYMDVPEDIEKKWTTEVFTSIVQNAENNLPFLCKNPRQFAMCNYVAATKETFVVHDVSQDKSFSWTKDCPVGPKFYSGSPVRIRGQVLATLCVLDWRPRPDFTKAHEIQQEQLAACVGREIENYLLRREMELMEEVRKLLYRSNSSNPKTSPPENEAAIIFTDVQGSTRLWEANPSAMENALSLHDDIMRNACAEFNGYEISTEGDAFHLAFHDSLDAIGFALKVQSTLHNAPWGNDILEHPDAAEVDGFRGLRIRIVVHSGPVHRRYNELSNRTEYAGETVYITKSMEDLAAGGQIIVTQDTWNGAAYLAETKLGSPQVIDIGSYVLQTGKTSRDGVIAKQLFQLLPLSLAYDYFGKKRSFCPTAAPEEAFVVSRRSSSRGTPNGRKFPPTKTSSRMRLSLSFYDAPAQDSNIVTIVFVYTSGIEELYGDTSLVLAALKDHIGTVLRNVPHLGGYQCKNTMLAFPNPLSAVQFGLALIHRLSCMPPIVVSDGTPITSSTATSTTTTSSRDWSKGIKVGICEGNFTSMGPHQTSGRADYFGTVVNRAARVAAAAENGQVCVGVPASEECPKLSDIILTDFIGLKELKGIEEEFALFSCRLVRMGGF